MKSMLLVTSLVLTAHAFAGTDSRDGIYGKDNRKEVYESNASFIELAKSTAAMIPAENFKKIFLSKSFKLKAETLKDRGICGSERFSSQPSAADCSGFLVAPNKLVTAGHCIKTMSDCDEYRWVFDYKLDSASQTSFKAAPENTYKCTRIISRQLDKTTKNDYALVELDRVVKDREPLKLRKSGSISKGDELVVIGHPTGLPTKIADGAIVRSTNSVFFVANLDTYGGNSGSAVFNTKTLEVEGILVRGDEDYVWASNGSCKISNVCADDDCRGEDVTNITNIAELMN